MGIKAQVAALEERIDALSLRERVLLFAAIVVVTYALVALALIRPLEHREQDIAARLRATRAQTAATERTLETLLAPKAQARELADLRALRAEVARLRARVKGLAAGLVPARAMPGLMRHVLSEAPGVALMALTTPPPKAIRNTPQSAPFLYRHEIRVVVRGRYTALVRYLALLAHQKRRVLWGRVALKADRYPDSTLTLHIYTLSARRALLR